MKLPDKLAKQMAGVYVSHLERARLEVFVRYCANVCERERLDDPVAGTSDDGYELAITHCTFSILREFGLEEM